MARLPDSVLRAMFARPVRSVCIRLPVVRAVYTGCLRRHPICGEIFDRSPRLRRWFAGVFPYASDEMGFGPEEQEAVVIWQSTRGARPDAFADRNRRITTKDCLSASLDG